MALGPVFHFSSLSEQLTEHLHTVYGTLLRGEWRGFLYFMNGQGDRTDPRSKRDWTD